MDSLCQAQSQWGSDEIILHNYKEESQEIQPAVGNHLASWFSYAMYKLE